MPASKQANVNRDAALDTIAWSEGTSTSPATKNDGYDVIVTGADGKPEVFTNYASHPFIARPPKVINSAGLESTASGRYQALRRFWVAEAVTQHYPSFEPQYQDAYAVQQWRERQALPLIDVGRFEAFIAAISPIWASLPGKGYIGQHQRTMAQLSAVYQAHGGLLTIPPSP